ncbi:hypothetical protein BDW42DRAFT_166490 [Aspergillus taichungensis]|uniref:Uncharacterized protein n=1 Tax=Aspergillus taichungensis TaxID=482145 RepID=A0A2J5HYE9_9EURO|nr:hypothetical protein BDW42DRAFT_166490 [Aspergillus taichungensis]
MDQPIPRHDFPSRKKRKASREGGREEGGGGQTAPLTQWTQSRPVEPRPRNENENEPCFLFFFFFALFLRVPALVDPPSPLWFGR